MIRYFLGASVTLFMGFAIISCMRSKSQDSSKQQMITSNLISDVKFKTGVDLPQSCRFILSSNYARLDSDVWLFEIGSSNLVKFPKQLVLQPQGDGHNMAKDIELMSGVSIGTLKAWYFGIWQISNAQCHATLMTASNSEYLMLERLY